MVSEHLDAAEESARRVCAASSLAALAVGAPGREDVGRHRRVEAQPVLNTADMTLGEGGCGLAGAELDGAASREHESARP
jgi:hypothetical protein